jgi:cellulose synthase/poly-beta-1,6-N-acetylglucosamine synthase-like glycosyltransferase
MNNITIKTQKYLIWISLLCVNAVLSSLVIIYYKYWYIFIILLGLSSVINSINVLLIIINKFYKLCFNIENENESENEDEDILQYKQQSRRHFTNQDTEQDTEQDTNQDTEQDIYQLTHQKSHNNSNFMYIIPCYNETESELNNTLQSIIGQKNLDDYTKKIIIICDGKISRANKNEKRTDEVLIDIIFKDYIKNKYTFEKSYKTWDGKWNDLDIYTGIMNNIDFIIIIKTYNIGKRDSLTLIRRMIYYYNMTVKNSSNQKDERVHVDYIDYIDYISSELIHFIDYNFNTNNTIINNQSIDFIIGTDADTILDKNCTYELITSFNKSNNNKKSKTYNNIVGVVGLVDVVKYWNPLVIYQYCEYLYAQFLRRFVQSKITFKVNCLSGCVQLIKVCNETCGNKILDVFNRLPDKNETIFNHIRSYASEDRNHICIMFNMYPYVKTIQSIKAVAYTHVPNTLMAFLRQRKRWSAGAACNDMLLVSNNKHNLWERLQSFTNILVWALTLFIFIVTIHFIIAIINHPTILMLILSSVMILPIVYAFMIPLFLYRDTSPASINKNKNSKNKNNKNSKNKKTKGKYTVNEITSIDDIENPNNNNKSIYFILFYYYVGFILYFTLSSVLNLLVYFYMLYNIDDLNWNSKSINNNTNNTNTNNTNNIKNLMKILDNESHTDTMKVYTIYTDTIDSENNTDTIDTTNTTNINDIDTENNTIANTIPYNDTIINSIDIKNILLNNKELLEISIV